MNDDERPVRRNISEVTPLPMAGIPPQVACPHCGGYVRGHQWIGQLECSINTWEWDRGVINEPYTRT